MKKIEELERENKAQADTINTLARQLLVAELEKRPDMKKCANVGLVADVIIADFHFGANAETGALQAHLDPERRYPSGRDLDSILATMKADPDAVFLLKPAAPKWEAPTENPWLKESFNLTRQGDVTRHNPELAEKWKAEAKRREHALRRASNA